MTNARVHVVHDEIVSAPAEAVWPYFNWPNLERMQEGGFFEAVSYEERRSIPGATRSIRLGGGNGNGQPLREQLELADPVAMRLRYRILDPAPMPIANYRGEVNVRALDAVRCCVRFECECVLNGIDESTWRDLYRNMQRANIAFIDKSLARNARS